MKHSNHLLSNPVKLFLILVALLFAAAASVLIITFTSADGGGDTPDTAVALADEVVTGSLNPGEQHWFTITPQDIEAEHTLTLEITPNNTNTISFVALNIFEDEQIPFFANGNISGMISFGEGVSTLNTSEIGQLSWTGLIAEATAYYVQISNSSDFSFDYTLTNVRTEISAPLEEAEEAELPAEAEEPSEAEVEAPLALKVENSPGDAEELSSEKVEGRLPANSTYWYTFSYDDTDPGEFRDLEYTLFFTPDDGNRKHNVNFQLYPYSEYEKWRRGEADLLTNFGAGSLVDRDGDDVTGELLWNGSVIKGDKYLLAISNGNDIDIDYHLFEGDIINPRLGPEPEPQPIPVYAEAEAPQTAIPLRLGVNKGGLEPGEEAWYSFSVADFDEEFFEEMALTMITTPDDGNRIHHINFEVFTADETKSWSPRDNSRINNLGAGAIVERDNNDETGERIWQGWVVDNEIYYVQIRNGTDVHMDYHLFPGDIYAPELGKKTEAPVREADEPGTTPWAPLALEVGVNKGQLSPGEERWYTFTRGDSATGGIIDSAFIMALVPADGNIVKNVHFRLFESDQRLGWSLDTPNISGFGQGSVVDTPQAGPALLWKGQVLGGGDYYLQVRNESDVLINYSIYPNDVIDTSLE